MIAGYSFDGGQTWKQTALPFSSCAPGGLNYERASDPWVSFGPDGTLYTVSISFNQSNNDNAVAAATSTDGGKTWSNLNVLMEDIGTYQYFNDKESITADPTKPGVAYVVWDRLVSPTDNPYAVAHSFAYTGPTWFCGNTWSKPQIIVNTGQNNQTIGNQIVVDPKTGTLFNFFDLIISTGSNKNKQHGYNVACNKSTDGGATWSSPQIISSIQMISVTDPNTGKDIRTGDILPEPAIDPATGNLYVVWQDGRFNGVVVVFMGWKLPLQIVLILILLYLIDRFTNKTGAISGNGNPALVFIFLLIPLLLWFGSFSVIGYV